MQIINILDDNPVSGQGIEIGSVQPKVITVPVGMLSLRDDRLLLKDCPRCELDHSNSYGLTYCRLSPGGDPLFAFPPEECYRLTWRFSVGSNYYGIVGESAFFFTDDIFNKVRQAYPENCIIKRLSNHAIGCDSNSCMDLGLTISAFKERVHTLLEGYEILPGMPIYKY